jgi:hypothetical protein
MKQLRLFNGRCPLQLGRDHAYICATTKTEAVRLGKEAFGEKNFSLRELNTYWAKCWGTSAKAVIGVPTEPGVYIAINEVFFKFTGAYNK